MKSIEQGYTKVPSRAPADPLDPCVPVEHTERMERIAPMNPKPVPGGFIPRNNIYDRY